MMTAVRCSPKSKPITKLSSPELPLRVKQSFIMTGGALKAKANDTPLGRVTHDSGANKAASLSATASLHAAPGSASHCLWRTLSQKCKMSPATAAPKLPAAPRVPFKPFDPLTDTLTPYPKEEELDAMADISEQFDGWDASWSPDLDGIKAKVAAAAKVNKAYGATFFAHSFTTLNLHSANITSIDAGFLNLINLTSLSLSHNNICRIENLPTSLLSLDVSYNDISALPPSMPVPLKVLSLAFNKVSSLDALATWFKVPRRSLVSLDCAFNDLSSLWNLRTLEGFSNLREFKCYGNPCSLDPQYSHACNYYMPVLVNLDATAVDPDERLAKLEGFRPPEAPVVLESPPLADAPRDEAAAAAVQEGQTSDAAVADASDGNLVITSQEQSPIASENRAPPTDNSPLATFHVVVSSVTGIPEPALPEIQSVEVNGERVPVRERSAAEKRGSMFWLSMQLPSPYQNLLLESQPVTWAAPLVFPALKPVIADASPAVAGDKLQLPCNLRTRNCLRDGFITLRIMRKSPVAPPDMTEAELEELQVKLVAESATAGSKGGKVAPPPKADPKKGTAAAPEPETDLGEVKYIESCAALVRLPLYDLVGGQPAVDKSFEVLPFSQKDVSVVASTDLLAVPKSKQKDMEKQRSGLEEAKVAMRVTITTNPK